MNENLLRQPELPGNICDAVSTSEMAFRTSDGGGGGDDDDDDDDEDDHDVNGVAAATQLHLYIRYALILRGPTGRATASNSILGGPTRRSAHKTWVKNRNSQYMINNPSKESVQHP